jgi:dihydrodipicolinate synthase/N-acetylneuraminate lyase
MNAESIRAIAEVFLALDPDGQINEEKTVKHIKYLEENGVKGFFVGGVAAEGLTYSVEERLRWLKIVLDSVDNKSFVIFNVCSINMDEIKMLVKKSEDLGADALSVTQPSPISFSEEDIMRYYGLVSSFSNKDLMLYNEPAIGNALKAETVKKIFETYDLFKYYKDSTHNMIDLHSLLSSEDPPSVFAGSDALIYDIMLSGGYGVVSLVIDVFPDIINKLVDLIQKGDYKNALNQQNVVLQIRSILKSGGPTAGYRYASGIMGVDLGNPRVPYPSISEKGRYLIREGLKNFMNR